MAVAEYRVCWCAQVAAQCSGDYAFAVDAGKFTVVTQPSGGNVNTSCVDNVAWRSKYGENCTWYSENDPGCTKFVDLGQLSNCKSTCQNCNGLKPEPDPLKTSCSMATLCECYQGCEPKVPCPVGESVDQCKMEVVSAGAGTPSPADSNRRWVEWKLESERVVLGVELQGDPGTHNHTTTFTASFSQDGVDFNDIDGGRQLAGNWEGRHTVRAYFSNGPVTASRLRLYPDMFAGMPIMNTRLVVQSCVVPLEISPAAAYEKICQNLRCMAFCHDHHWCSGEFEAYCERQKKTPPAGMYPCDVDCGSAERRGLIGAILSLLSVLARGLSQL